MQGRPPRAFGHFENVQRRDLNASGDAGRVLGMIDTCWFEREGTSTEPGQVHSCCLYLSVGCGLFKTCKNQSDRGIEPKPVPTGAETRVTLSWRTTPYQSVSARHRYPPRTLVTLSRRGRFSSHLDLLHTRTKVVRLVDLSVLSVWAPLLYEVVFTGQDIERPVHLWKNTGKECEPGLPGWGGDRVERRCGAVVFFPLSNLYVILNYVKGLEDDGPCQTV